MTISTQFNIWSNNKVLSRGVNYSEAALSILFNRERRRINSVKYRQARYRLNVIKNLDNFEYYLLSRDAQGKYPILSRSREYGDNKFSCIDAGAKCLPHRGTDKDCNKSSCYIGYLEDIEGELFKITELSGEEYFTINTLKNDSFEIERDFLSGLTREEFKRTIAIKAYERKCGLSEACINSSLASQDKEDLTLALISYLNTQSIGWKNYVLKLVEPLLDLSNLSAFEFLNSFIEIVFSIKNKILIYRTQKINNFRHNIDKDFPRPVYYRLPACYISDLKENDIIFLRDISQRVFLDRNEINIGTLVVSSNLKTGFRYNPRRIINPSTKLSFGLDPFDPNDSFSPRDLSSWEEIFEEDIPKLDISRWLTSGYDYFLSDNFLKISRFFHDFIDPSTCLTMALDWNHQFFGWKPNMWNPEWDEDTKRGLLLNSLGWEDSRASFEREGKIINTYKGYILEKFPFNKHPDFWIKDGKEFDSFSNHFFGEVNLVKYVLNGELVEKDYDVNYTIDKLRWEGLFPLKGTLISLLFLFSVFKIYDTDYKNEIKEVGEQLEVDLTQDAREDKPIKPIILNSLQTGSSGDLYALDNIFIAGMSRINYRQQRVIFPVSYRYNRLGRFWEYIKYLIDEWTPLGSKIHVQYPFLAADYAVADDYYFEPYEH